MYVSIVLRTLIGRVEKRKGWEKLKNEWTLSIGVSSSYELYVTSPLSMW